MESLAAVAGNMEPARDLTVEAAQSLGVSKAFKSSFSSKTPSSSKIKALLDSRSDRDIVDGLRRVVAMIYLNKPCLPYFSAVVKNVANPNIEVKKLVYIYLVHYAESDPDLALLSVNAIQKSLTDQNPQVRAMALRTMAGMRVPVISQIVSLAIKRGVADLSPYVRKAAALAIPKCYRLEPNTLPQLTDCITTLLADKQYFVVGPAVQAFLELCPDRIDLVHKHYRAIVRKLVDMDEWGQLATLRLLLPYCRRCFPQKKQKVATTATVTKKRDFYDDDDDDKAVNDEEVEKKDAMDPDLDSFLKQCRLLLTNRSPAVTTAAASCLLYLGTDEHVADAIGPLLAWLRSSPEVREVVMPNIVSIALQRPMLFVPHATKFLIGADDSTQVWRLKMEMLTLLFPHVQSWLQTTILNEFENFAHSTNVDQIREAVRSIGRCAQGDAKSASRCFKVLLDQLSSFDNLLVSEVLTVMRHLIQRDPHSHRKTIVRLARNLDRTTGAEARATIIWLVGEFVGLDGDNTDGNLAPDVLRILMTKFADESEEAKHQIVLLGAKVYLQHLQSLKLQSSIPDNDDDNDIQHEEGQQLDDTHPVVQIWNYLQLLVRYDTSYDLRDRARLFRALLADPSSTQLASLIISAPKPIPHTPSPSENRQDLSLGSSTLAVSRDVAGSGGLPDYQPIPEWVQEGDQPDPKLRDEGEGVHEDYVSQAERVTTTAASKRLDAAVKEQGLEKVVAAAAASANKAGGSKGKSLDAWLDESDAEGDGSGTTEYETDDDEEDDEENSESGEEESDAEEEESDGGESEPAEQEQRLLR